MEFTCSLCGKEEEKKMKICMICNVARYCNKKCQREDWKNHKNHCTIFHEIYPCILTKKQKKWLMKFDDNQIINLLKQPDEESAECDGNPIGLRKLLKKRGELDKENDYIMWSFAIVMTREILRDKTYCKYIIKKAKRFQEENGLMNTTKKPSGSITISTKEFCINMKQISNKNIIQKATFAISVLGTNVFSVGL